MAAYSLSTLETIVADFGDNSATVAEFGDATGAVIVTADDDDNDDATTLMPMLYHYL